MLTRPRSTFGIIQMFNQIHVELFYSLCICLNIILGLVCLDNELQSPHNDHILPDYRILPQLV
jgi:hypothetical protein